MFTVNYMYLLWTNLRILNTHLYMRPEVFHSCFSLVYKLVLVYYRCPLLFCCSSVNILMSMKKSFGLPRAHAPDALAQR